MELEWNIKWKLETNKEQRNFAHFYLEIIFLRMTKHKTGNRIIWKFGSKTISNCIGLLKEIIENICLELNFEFSEGDKSAMVGINRT